MIDDCFSGHTISFFSNEGYLILVIKWKVEWYDMDNPSRTRMESGVWAKAYKVEIEGATAWLPHSILGEIYSSPWAGSRIKHPSATIEVPEWWYQKNVLSIRPA